MDTANTLSFRIQHLAAQLEKESDQVLQEQLGIGMSQLRILQALQTQPDIRQCDIATELGQTEASISRQVKLMIEAGLLRVAIGPKDRREHLTLLTHKGLRFADAALSALAAYYGPAFEMLSNKDQERFTAVLDALHNRVCASKHVAP